ncbi:hypothetical protein [Xenococcus sp. PCC 7305]|nr:hypothetical protein [Xenococcus sp. PCC 7305]
MPCESYFFAIAQRQALPDRISCDVDYAITLKQIYVIHLIFI